MKNSSGFVAVFVGLFAFLTLFVAKETRAEGIKIFVSVSGNDKNSGVMESPLATIGAAVSKLRILRKGQTFDGPVEVIIEDGQYLLAEPLVLNPEDSGTEKSPVIFKAQVGAHPVFSGGKNIKGFEKLSENLWCAKIPEVAEYGWNFEQLYVNGKRAVRAKSPNSGFYALKDVSETVINKGKELFPDLAVQRLNISAEVAERVALISKEEYGNAVVTFYHNWDNTRKHILGFDKDASAVFIGGEGMKPWNNLNKNSLFILENYRAALDTCGEWFLDPRGYLYYMHLLPEPMPELADQFFQLQKTLYYRSN